MEVKFEDPDSLIFEARKDAPTILKALETVKAFILEKKLLLTGGMAIDFALKLAGKEGIYSDSVLPDYDFFSPTFHEHAYELGYRLCQAGMPHITVINAIHVMTMKVRVNFVVVADITFMDRDIFESARYLETKEGLRIIHPHYVMSTQFSALSMPYSGYPREAILQRWEKDMKRFSLLEAAYPIEPPSGKIKMIKQTVDFAPIAGLDPVLTGWAALCYWSTNSSQGDSKLSFQYDAKRQEITYMCPQDAQMPTCATIHLDKYKPSKKAKHRLPFLDVLPRSIEDGWCISDVYGQKNSAYHDKDMNLKIMCPPYIMREAIIGVFADLNKSDREMYLQMRKYVVAAVAAAVADKLDPLLPYPYTYGDHLESANYVANLYDFLAEVGLATEDDVKAFALPEMISMDSACVIPDKVKKFDITASLFFQSNYQYTTVVPDYQKERPVPPPQTE